MIELELSHDPWVGRYYAALLWDVHVWRPARSRGQEVRGGIKRRPILSSIYV